jgi:hypothetical protein
MPFYIHTATVTGSGSFPEDMLRYDCAYPDRQEDVNTIIMSKDRETREKGKGINICTINNWPVPKWTPDRWLSFGWKLEHKQTRRLEYEGVSDPRDKPGEGVFPKYKLEEMLFAAAKRGEQCLNDWFAEWDEMLRDLQDCGVREVLPLITRLAEAREQLKGHPDTDKFIPVDEREG